MCVHVKERDRVRERGGKRERERESVCMIVCVGFCLCWFYELDSKIVCICRYLPPTIAKVAGVPVL